MACVVSLGLQFDSSPVHLLPTTLFELTGNERANKVCVNEKHAEFVWAYTLVTPYTRK